jgi:hypothetical protein
VLPNLQYVREDTKNAPPVTDEYAGASGDIPVFEGEEKHLIISSEVLFLFKQYK